MLYQLTGRYRGKIFSKKLENFPKPWIGRGLFARQSKNNFLYGRTKNGKKTTIFALLYQAKELRLEANPSSKHVSWSKFCAHYINRKTTYSFSYSNFRNTWESIRIPRLLTALEKEHLRHKIRSLGRHQKFQHFMTQGAQSEKQSGLPLICHWDTNNFKNQYTNLLIAANRYLFHKDNFFRNCMCKARC